LANLADSRRPGPEASTFSEVASNLGFVQPSTGLAIRRWILFSPKEFPFIDSSRQKKMGEKL
jgi:hypothetical protein